MIRRRRLRVGPVAGLATGPGDPVDIPFAPQADGGPPTKLGVERPLRREDLLPHRLAHGLDEVIVMARSTRLSEKVAGVAAQVR